MIFPGGPEGSTDGVKGDPAVTDPGPAVGPLEPDPKAADDELEDAAEPVMPFGIPPGPVDDADAPFPPVVPDPVPGTVSGPIELSPAASAEAGIGPRGPIFHLSRLFTDTC